jgi:hypothetical protein
MGTGLKIKTSALPMPLLTHHCEQITVMGVKAAATAPQAVTIKFEFACPQKQAENIDSLLHLTHGHRQSQSQQIRGRGLGFNLPAQHCFQQIHRQQSSCQTAAQHLHIHGMGEVAQTSGQGLIQTIHPLEQRIRHLRQQTMVSNLVVAAAELGDFLLEVGGGMLKGIAGELEQRAQNIHL